MTFVLCNIRSAWNVGSAFRTAECLGAKIILAGYTPRPVDSNLKLIKKTAIGAENHVEWIDFADPNLIFQTYKNSCHLAAEICSESKNIFEFLSSVSDQNPSFFKNDFLIWFGNEIHGLEKNVLDQCSHVLHLPLEGKKESLNVSSSLAAVGYLLQYKIYSNNQKHSFSDV
jgi:tRNA G18 (ribose-2'-O)-methylase SpoU